MITYKYKLYNSNKNKYLHLTIDNCGRIYNHCIALCNKYYYLYKKHLNSFKLKKFITKLKKIEKYRFWNTVPSQTIQAIIERIDFCYKMYFKRLANNKNPKIKIRPPGFIKIKQYKSFVLKQHSIQYKDRNTNIVVIQKRKYKFFKSRPVIGNIKNIIIKRDSIGDLYIHFICDKQNNNVTFNRKSNKAVGYDFGLKIFLTASDKNNIEYPLFLKKSLSKIKLMNKKLSKKNKGSNNYNKLKIKLAKLHRKIKRQRKDFRWKTTREMCKKYSIICLEDLCISGISKVYGRKMIDIALYEFIHVLEETAKKFGTIIIKIDRFYPSSQICNKCGFKNKDLKNLRIRDWICPNCGTKLDRDINAAINILNQGLSLINCK